MLKTKLTHSWHIMNHFTKLNKTEAKIIIHEHNYIKMKAAVPETVEPKLHVVVCMDD